MQVNDNSHIDGGFHVNLIGITGGIGSGKTTVAKLIEELGYSVYYSDNRAKEIVNEDPLLKLEISALLGDSAYDDNGWYNRKYVSKLVFENKEILQKLNQIIHPAVAKDFKIWVTSQQSKYVFKESALLFELNLDKECFKTVLVTAEENIRIKRVMDRDSKTYREIKLVMDKQMPEKDKIGRADFVIYNNEGLDVLKMKTSEFITSLE